jgi:hypothetical protein
MKGPRRNQFVRENQFVGKINFVVHANARPITTDVGEMARR